MNHKIYDPCFVKPASSKTIAVCPQSVWSNKSVEITVPTPLDSSYHQPLDMSRTYPWAVELVSGEKCYGVEATKQIEGLPIHYQCSKNTLLIGHVQRCEAVWHMLQYNQNGISTVDIAKAWF